MCFDKKTEFADQLCDLLNKFSICFKISNLTKICLNYSPRNSTQMLTKHQLIQTKTEQKTKHMEINLGNYYCKYINQDKSPYLRKFVAYQ